MAEGPFGHLAGTRFPGGSANVPRWMNQLWCDAVGAAQNPSPYVHPVLVYYAAVQGSGLSFADIFEILDGSAESGIMLGEQRLEFREPVEIERDYAVDGEITEVLRKAGRRAGIFDVATFQLRLHDDTTDPVATITTSFVFPRHETNH